jgi:DNA-binding NtrC family response regulator
MGWKDRSVSIEVATVLMIDDSETQRQLFVRTIQNALAPRVRAVASIGVSQVESVVPWGEVDAVVLDMVLGDGEPQGYDSIVAVRRRCAAPIIVYSGSYEGDDLKRVKLLAKIGGMIGYVEKNQGPDFLIDAIATAIGARRQSQSEQHDLRREVTETRQLVGDASKTQAEMLEEIKLNSSRIGSLEETVDGTPGKLGLASHCERRTKLLNRIAWVVFATAVTTALGAVVTAVAR